MSDTTWYRFRRRAVRIKQVSVHDIQYHDDRIIVDDVMTRFQKAGKKKADHHHQHHHSDDVA